ncbi:hypothetical protein H0H93_016190 [Arthromyces matolae]|nr:hypothetical protein H0H93_016190 [Arthromyces matolae]
MDSATHQMVDNQGFKQLQRHPLYYINSGDVHFLVENQRFRVHRYFFERESRVFREQTFQLSPLAEGGSRKGDEETSAIEVLDASATAFAKLLGVFYNPRYSLFDWAINDWTDVLELAQKWEFLEVHNLAIREIERNTGISLIDRIVLYQRFNVDQDLLLPLYASLCSRPESLSEEESEALGIKTTVLIFRARERLRARPSDGGMSPLPSGLDDRDVHHALTFLLDEASPSANRTGEHSQLLLKNCGLKVAGDPTKKGKQRSPAGRNFPITLNSNGRTGRPVGPAAAGTKTLATYAGVVNDGEGESDRLLKAQLGIVQHSTHAKESPIHYEVAAKYLPALINKFRANEEVLTPTVTLLNVISHTPYFVRFLQTPAGQGIAVLQAERMANAIAPIDSMPVDKIGEIGQFLSTLLVLEVMDAVESLEEKVGEENDRRSWEPTDHASEHTEVAELKPLGTSSQTKNRRRGSISITRFGQTGVQPTVPYGPYITSSSPPATPPLSAIASKSSFYRLHSDLSLKNSSTKSFASGASALSGEDAYREDNDHATQMLHISGRQSISKTVGNFIPRRLSRSRSANVLVADANVVIGVSVEEATVESSEPDIETARTVIHAPKSLRNKSSRLTLAGYPIGGHLLEKVRMLAKRLRPKHKGRA